MAVPVQCPACQHPFAVPDEYAGRKGKCPQCGHVFRAAPVAEPAAEQVAAPAPPKSPAPPAASRPAAPPPRRAPQTAAATATPPAGVPVVPPAAAGPLFATEPTSPGLDRHRPRARGHDQTKLLALVAGGGVLALVLGFGVVWLAIRGGTSSSPPATADADPLPGDTDNLAAAEALADPTAARPPATASSSPPGPAASRLSAAEQTALWRRIEPAIVRLEIETRSGPRSGLGVMIDPQGRLAAPAELLVGATKATAIIREEGGEIRRPIAGVAVHSATRQVAVLAIEPELLVQYTALAPATGRPGIGAELWSTSLVSAGGGVTPCRVRRVVGTGELPPAARATLRKAGVDENLPLSWLQVDASIGEDQAGAPLIDDQGRFVGLQMNLSGLSIDGIALAAEHVFEVASTASGAVEPFDSAAPAVGDLAASEAPRGVDPPAPDPRLDPTTPPTPAPVEPELPAEPVAAEEAPAFVARAAARLRAISWSPTTAADYRVAAIFARTATTMQFMADRDDVPEPLREQLGAAAMIYWRELTELRWPTVDVLAKVNGQAIDALGGEERGFFGFATVTIPSSRLQVPEGNKPLVVLKLDGTEQQLLLPAGKNAEQLTEGSEWLIVGIHEAANRVELNGQNTPVVSALVLLGRPE